MSTSNGVSARSIALLTLGLAASCGERAATRPHGLAGTLTIVGSSTIGPVVADLAVQFERLHADLRIDVETGGSSRGVAAVRAGLAEIGMVSRALKPQESDLRAHLLARDGIAMIVNAALPSVELGRARIQAIYTGAVTNWRELGGPDLAITVVHKAEGRSTLELFLDHFAIEAGAVRASVVIGENQQGIKTVSSVPGAIGYVSIGAAEAALSEGASIRLIALEGVEANSMRVQDGSYALSRELNLVTRGEPSAAAAAFIGFCRSARSVATLREYFLVPLH